MYFEHSLQLTSKEYSMERGGSNFTDNNDLKSGDQS